MTKAKMAERVELSERSLVELGLEIEEQLDERRPYWNNIIGLVLREISERFGVKAANQAIDDFNLTSLGWNKEKEKRR